MLEDEKKVAIALPGEWALQKVFGPALTEIGEDLKKLYAKGRDKIISTAYRKISNPEDGKQANLRVTRDVLWNGAFTEDEVCAEYFGGVLASSRSAGGSDDDAIQFVDVIKSMSAKQLHLHYVIYRALNVLFLSGGKAVNVAQGAEIQRQQVWFASHELVSSLGLRIERDLNILHRQGLLHQYKTDVHVVADKGLQYTSANPTTFGVLLYAAAHNRLDDWRSFDRIDLGTFGEIPVPSMYSSGLAELSEKVGLVPPTPVAAAAT